MVQVLFSIIIDVLAGIAGTALIRSLQLDTAIEFLAAIVGLSSVAIGLYVTIVGWP
jgi:uncharacterized membrane protein